MKTIGRDKIRRRPLEGFCYKAETTRDNKNGIYVFCRGFHRPECIRCEAYRPKEDFET